MDHVLGAKFPIAITKDIDISSSLLLPHLYDPYYAADNSPNHEIPSFSFPFRSVSMSLNFTLFSHLKNSTNRLFSIIWLWLFAEDLLTPGYLLNLSAIVDAEYESGLTSQS